MAIRRIKKPAKATNAKLTESDLYPPLRDFLTANGYTVRSEVAHCDVAATKDEHLILVEIKRSLTTSLLIQAIRRQRVTPSVYVAVPRQGVNKTSRRWRDVRMLLRQLELGLILVDLRKKRAAVEIAFHPVPFDRRANRKAQRAIIEEMNGRSVDLNRGGATRIKLVTAYRERAVQIACCLEKLGTMSPAQLRALDTGTKTTSILYSNVYGWFDRVGRGLYALNPRGRRALKSYPELAEHYRAALETVAPASPVDSLRKAG